MIRFVVVAASAIGLIVFVSFIAVRLIRSRTAGMSVRMQIFLALALIVGAFSFGLGILVLDRVKERATLLGREAALDEAQAVASLVAADIQAANLTLEQVGRKIADGHAATGSPTLHLALFDPAGRSVFSSGRSADDEGTVSVSVPIVLHGQSVGSVRVIKPTLVIRETLADFAPSVLIISLLLGAVAAASAALIGRAIATPIEQLTAFAERVSAGERAASPPAGHGREVQRLSRALDSMRRELQGRPFVEAFAADLSHELKNPVAAIRASAEVLHDGAAAEPEQAAHFLARILEATSRIETLLGDLLSLARLEARGVQHATLVDLRKQAEAAAETAREHGSHVELSLQPGTNVRGDASWLRCALENLLDNARIHGAPDRPIRILVARDADEVVCRIESEGEVEAHVQKRLFRRFVTTRAQAGGTGLGLAIVRAIAEAHSGRAECDLPGPPIVRFELRLPAA